MRSPLSMLANHPTRITMKQEPKMIPNPLYCDKCEGRGYLVADAEWEPYAVQCDACADRRPAKPADAVQYRQSEVTVGMVTAALAALGEHEVSLSSMRRREVTKMIKAALDWRPSR